MSILGNILWIFLGGGLIIFFEYLIGGIVLCLTIVGIPFGVQCIKISMLALVPFGKEVVAKPSSSGCLSVIMNIIWIFICGLGIAITHMIFALICAITIIGIPFAKQHIKLARLAIMPFGSDIK
ncbi:MAG TPA: YccF domain-containing protein [Clostridia bacterium]|nr:YccF domain-containing protein [Clostridia bacterium]